MPSKQVGVGIVAGLATMATISLVTRHQRRHSTSHKPQRARQHNAFMERTPDAVAFLDEHMAITDASRSLAGLFYQGRETLVGLNLNTLLRSPDGQDLIATLRSLGTDHGEARITGLTPQGTSVPLGLRAIDLNDGDARGWFVRLKDLSRQNQLDRLKSDFVSTVSHELRTPLSSIAGALGLVSAGATGPLSSDASEMIQIALNNTDRLIRLINDLLDVEKIEAGRVHFTLAIHSASELARVAVDGIKPFADMHEVNVTMEQSDDDDFVEVDPDRIIQVFTNLLSNAIKFSPVNGLVRIVIRSSSAFHRIEVIDQGSGIPESFRDKVFSKFAQADTSGSRQVGGTGLGLAISRQIVDRLGGKLWFLDTEGGGTTFCLDLPAASTLG